MATTVSDPSTIPSNNAVCERCVKKCKQSSGTLIISCPKFEACSVQLEIKLTGIKTKRKRLAI